MLYRRGNRWWFKFMVNGQLVRESAGTASRNLAVRAERARRSQIEEGAAGVKKRKPKLFREALKAFLVEKKDHIRQSSLAIEMANSRHLLPVLGGRLLTDLDATVINRYIATRREAGAAARTVKLEIGTLRGILRREGLWANLQPHIHTKALESEEEIGRAITLEEERLLLTACAASRSLALLPGFALAVNTGLRYGELVGLRWGRIDLDRRRISVGDSKTRAGAGRTVPLNARSTEALSFWAARFPDRQPQDYVFPSERYGANRMPTHPSVRGARPGPTPTGLPYGTDPTRPIKSLAVAWRAAKQRAGVECRWHDLRHTFCSRAIDAGMSFPQLAATMGWSASTTATMTKRYGHPTVEKLREPIDRMNGPEGPGWAQFWAQPAVPEGVEKIN